MRNLTPATITQAFAEYAKAAPSARARELLVSLAGHLHSFVRDNKVTEAEWGAAIEALTRAVKFTDDKRNEYILFSDLLGVSSLVDMVNASTEGTPSSVLGPFHIENAPALPNGGDLWKGQVGEPLVVSGKVVDETGAPAAGTVLALWQNAGNGLYAQQDPKQGPTNYHARLEVAPDGTFAFSTVRPLSYTVPDDGPAGDMLRALGREAWRPAHLHMIVQAPGRRPLITEFFPEDDKYLDRDAVFGVRAGLVLPFRRAADRAALPANLAARESLPLPVWTVTIDIRLPPAVKDPSLRSG
jgi:protocatechuate 3,4-dioxygenase beta subunit